ncbi:hypothetical protein ANCDUO_09281 [Ancylostoma duodenale]|uniref:Uncharacterized protein n=1 Tax=Ancylostoma duodenale TaxID=51022 RepID=A0A0C2GN36_9BILA|nr:hypothetical protein ANCDUO_09281 [Ancylostoma duodenale]
MSCKIVDIQADLDVQTNGAWLGLGISKDDLMASHLGATEMLLKDSYTELRDGRALCGAEWMLDFTVLDASEKKLVRMDRYKKGMGSY